MYGLSETDVTTGITRGSAMKDIVDKDNPDSWILRVCIRDGARKEDKASTLHDILD